MPGRHIPHHPNSSPLLTVWSEDKHSFSMVPSDSFAQSDEANLSFLHPYEKGVREHQRATSLLVFKLPLVAMCASSPDGAWPDSWWPNSLACRVQFPTSGNSLAPSRQDELPAILAVLSQPLPFSSRASLEWVVARRFLSRVSVSRSA